MEVKVSDHKVHGYKILLDYILLLKRCPLDILNLLKFQQIVSYHHRHQGAHVVHAEQSLCE